MAKKQIAGSISEKDAYTLQYEIGSHPLHRLSRHTVNRSSRSVGCLECCVKLTSANVGTATTFSDKGYGQQRDSLVPSLRDAAVASVGEARSHVGS